MMFNRELLKGSTALILLQLLNERAMYGYELVKEMEKRSEYTLRVKEGTLYPALHKLEKQGYIEAFWEKPEKGPARKYYKLTKAGEKLLKEKTSEWALFSSMVNRVLGKS